MDSLALPPNQYLANHLTEQAIEGQLADHRTGRR